MSVKRTDEQLEELIQELGKHHGEENFGIVKDVLLSNGDLPESELFDTLAMILNQTPYVRPPKILQRPKNAENESGSVQNGNQPLSPPDRIPLPKYPGFSGANNDGPSITSGKSAPTSDPKAPFKSIWKTVVEEHQASSYTEKPPSHDSEVDAQFEAVDMDALEDVDPIALEMAKNPDFFKPVPNSSEYEQLLMAQANTLETSSEPPVASDAPKSSEIFSASQLATQTLNLEDNEDSAINDEPIPAYLLSGLQKPNISSSAPNGPLFAPLRTSTPENPSRDSLMSSSTGLASSTASQAHSSESSIDFYLPHPPATDEEERVIKDRLNVSIRSSSHWGASGDYGVAPAPSRLRESLNSSIDLFPPDHPSRVIDLTNEPDFKLDEEALDFLGGIFPDFEVSYLADCLRGANNDVKLVSDFLMPVLMEEIEIDAEYNESPYDYSQHIASSSEHPQFSISDQMDLDNEQDTIDLDPNDFEEIPAEEALPEEDASFNSHYHVLVEMFPHVDRDWVLDALINTENQLERAADLLMRGIIPETIEIPDEQGNAPRRRPKKGRQNKFKRVPIHLGAPNAWARPLAKQTSAPLSEYPMLGGNAMDFEASPHKGPIRIRPPQAHRGGAVAQGGAELLPRPGFGPSNLAGRQHRRAFQREMDDNIEAPRYVPNESQSGNAHWAQMVIQANQLFEQNSRGASNAVAAFSKSRAGARLMISALQATNESWISIMEQAGKTFYVTGESRLDLHGLRLRPASKLVAALLQAHWEHGNSDRTITIITGRGAHCVDGISRIKEDIKRQVCEYQHDWVNPGAVRVLLPKPRV